MKQATVLMAGLAKANAWAGSSDPGGSTNPKPTSSNAGEEPWYRRAVLWGQTNIAEIDPDRYDISWWRGYWKRTQIQGVIVNAGGIVAYYPTRIPLHHQADYLKGRDLFGELCRAAHEDGLAVFAAETAHTYLRHVPELRAGVDGPHTATEPKVAGTRHAVLHGFEETDILPFGGFLEPLELDRAAQVLMTFIPPSPVSPPEESWMREPKTNIAGLILNTTPGGSRIAFLAADLDRRFGRDNLPDHGNLLANLVRWLSKDDLPLAVEGPGLLDCHLYQQPGRVILHLVNLTNSGTWRQHVEELLPIGPLRVRLRLPKAVHGTKLRSLVSSKTTQATVSKGWASFTIDSIVDHEVLVLS